jgi:aryl-alcohol dehydrogenase-like predicted oxidoreductase
MQRRTFGKTGLEVSILGFGGAPVGFLETEQREVAAILNNLLDQGVNLIDTAAGYSGSEQMIGKTIGHRRDEYILVSKCGREMDGIEGAAWSEAAVLNTLDQALARLQTDHLDVMLLHTCDLETLKRGEAVGALVKARDAGKIRFLGYAGDNEAAAFAAGLDDVAVI